MSKDQHIPSEVTQVRIGLHVDGRKYEQSWAVDRELLNRVLLKDMYTVLGEKFSNYMADELFLKDSKDG